MAVIADKCPDILVNVVDISEEKIMMWNNSNVELIPVYEPGLSKLIEKRRGINLYFSNCIAEKIKEAETTSVSFINSPLEMY